MSYWMKRVLGEGSDDLAPASGVPPVDAPDAEPAEVSPVNEPQERVSPTIDNLAKAWESGSKVAVATRILDALDSYADFVSLCFALGQEGATELGHIMDELTADETSPRERASDDIPPDALLGGEQDDELPPPPTPRALKTQSV